MSYRLHPQTLCRFDKHPWLRFSNSTTKYIKVITLVTTLKVTFLQGDYPDSLGYAYPTMYHSRIAASSPQFSRADIIDCLFQYTWFTLIIFFKPFASPLRWSYWSLLCILLNCKIFPIPDVWISTLNGLVFNQSSKKVWILSNRSFIKPLVNCNSFNIYLVNIKNCRIHKIN